MDINQIIELAEAVGRSRNTCRQGEACARKSGELKTRGAVFARYDLGGSAVVCVACWDRLCEQKPNLTTECKVVDGRKIPPLS